MGLVVSYLESVCENLHRNIRNIREHYAPFLEDNQFILDTASLMESQVGEIETYLKEKYNE